MKRIIKVCALVFAFVLLFSVAGCKSCKKEKDPVIESIEIVDEQINEDGTHAIIAAVITYGDGSQDKEYCDLLLQEDGWVIDANLYAK